MAYFVGIDSGGTKTECWLADDTRVLARVLGPTAKITRVSPELATERLRTLLAELAHQSQVDLRAVSRTCIGLSGYSILQLRDWAAHTAANLLGGHIDLCGDDEIALDAAFHGGPGILVIGGTGAAVLGRSPQGARITAGGWGPAVGDEGSGYWIGREALRRVFRAYDEGLPTALADAIRLAWNAADLHQIVGLANARPGPDFATLVPVVVRCAQAGDPLATRLLAKAGRELARQVKIVLTRLNHASARAGVPPTTPPPLAVAYTGSVLEKIPAVHHAMRLRLADECPTLTLLDQPVNPLEGALWRARNAISSPNRT